MVLAVVSFYCHFFSFNIIYFPVLGLSFGMWDLVLRPGIKPRPPALGARSLGHWTISTITFFADLCSSVFEETETERMCRVLIIYKISDTDPQDK